MSDRGAADRSLSWDRIWREHTRSYQPDILANEVHPKLVLPVLLGATALLLGMYLVPKVQQFTGFDLPWVPLGLLWLGGLVTLIQWRLWKRQRLVHILCLIDNCLYSLAVVAVMVDTSAPIRYAFGLLYAQMAAHYGNRYAFTWPHMVSIAVIPFATTLYFVRDDFGLLALALFGALMFIVTSTTTRHARRIEWEKERYRAAYTLTDKVASESLDIAIATSMAELGNFVHELRNTSTPVLANLMLLKEQQDLSPEIQESIESIERSTAQSAELIEKMLTTIKRRAVVHDSTFLLSDVLSPESFGHRLKAEHRRRVVVENPDLAFEITGNPEHLGYALDNLIQNAFEAGAKRLVVSAALDGGLERAIIRLADDGPGIPPALIGGLFQPDATSRKGRSHGLGLPLTRRFVEILGGTLRLVKTDATGTTFEIVLGGRHTLDETTGREVTAA